LGKIPVNVNQMNVDLLTASSHKMYGPKGVALLYVRQGTKIEPLLHGGGQEKGLRPSTVNVPAVVGFAKAAQICQKSMKRESRRLARLRDKLIKGVLKSIPHCRLNGHPEKRLPNNVNFSFDFVEGESLVFQLSLQGFCVSTGSACSSEKLQASHVLLAIGLKPEQSQGSLRISLGRWTQEDEIRRFLKILPGAVKNLRKLSPFKS
jgi:cysteine desulfurase